MSIHRTTPPDKVVGRQPETQPLVCVRNQQTVKPADRIIRVSQKRGSISGPGEFGSNPSGFGFVRWEGIGLAKPLDLVPNSLRQNDSK
ncbi:hypothetical protein [Phyllobacterium bourgognense]|uniref:Uncharacterized protein n=1 Tax=Phyllobacterium bourgognense TaxID=314236 RepID=A0A368YYW2_9HYPH|nr:hypothetical protein [Phyllobacterium bourgognense]RCW85383.1 hypothetical protein C7476_103225 [Phyllobacterium bourgognense]